MLCYRLLAFLERRRLGSLQQVTHAPSQLLTASLCHVLMLVPTCYITYIIAVQTLRYGRFLLFLPSLIIINASNLLHLTYLYKILLFPPPDCRNRWVNPVLSANRPWSWFSTIDHAIGMLAVRHYYWILAPHGPWIFGTPHAKAS